MGPPFARMYVHVADLAGFWPRSNLPHNNIYSMHMKIFIELMLARDVFVFLECN